MSIAETYRDLIDAQLLQTFTGAPLTRILRSRLPPGDLILQFPVVLDRLALAEV